MKNVTIRLPDVEAAILVEVQKDNRAYRDLQRVILQKGRNEYQAISR